MPELSPRFNFQDVEGKWEKIWEDNQIFHATPNAQKKPYSIVIPPPNVTGILHMGHALNNTLQDILARYKRMNGYETCWMPGTDHAGIATQNVVEKQLAKEGKTRYDIGREEMLNRLWAWKQQYGDTIINQLKKLGSSCDWARTRFTMDEEYSAAVRFVFVSLYKKGLIYRGKYIINWCPRCQTALSDEEAEHREQQGALYHIKYARKDSPDKYVVVATTRPETMLGDTAVAVNPNDPRYKLWIGKTLILPIVNREIKIIADELVDPAFGTGAVKVTPAHDPNDFAMGTRHHLEFINVMHPDGRMNELAQEFNGRDRFEAREAIIETLKDLKLLDKVEPHTHAVGHCYRCNTIIEPYLSKQWFVKMKPLAEPALQAVSKGDIRFYPERWTKVYTNWLEGIRDWCISRQIWWGHRIPVWYCDTCDDPIVSETTPQQCPHCGSKNLKQDEDVLDTWFSSWLWPFATFGWPANSADRPAKNHDLEYFYPTSSLFTASEIIFFWVSRMIMAGYEFMGKAPFRDIYIHGTVRDAKGRKMSKSLGNAIDPLEIINEYGADALRFSLILNSGQDLFISKEKFEVGRNFANKVWNASRLVLSSDQRTGENGNPQDLTLASQWIVSKFYNTLVEVNRAIESFRFSEAENLIFDFFWKTYCDWYLEIIKNHLHHQEARNTAMTILTESLRMLHPFMPFVTEELWATIHPNSKPLSLESWPVVHPNLMNPQAEAQMEQLINLISSIRNTKSLWGIKSQESVDCHISSNDWNSLQLIKTNQEIIKSLARIKSLEIHEYFPILTDATIGVSGTIKYALPLAGLVDISKEKAKMSLEIEQAQKAADSLSQRLSNENFVSKAPADVIEKEKERLFALSQKIKELKEVLTNLQ